MNKESLRVMFLIFVIVLLGDLILFAIYNIPITIQSIAISGLIAMLTDFALDKFGLSKRC